MTTRIVTDANGRKHITNEPLLHPPQRKPLSDEEIRLQWSEFWETECHPWAIQFARAIEQAHGIGGQT